MVSAVIPAFNEAERIAPTLRAVSTWFRAHAGGDSYELLVVDDGSTDATIATVHALTSDLPHLRLLDSRPNRGKGHVVQLGMLAARGDVRLFMDADHSVPITMLPRLLEPLRGGADVAIGSRYVPGARMPTKSAWYRRAWSRLGNRVVQAGLVDGILDTQCGFKAFTGAAAAAIFSRTRFTGWGFDIEVLALARALGFTIVECPVDVHDDRRTHVRPIRDAIGITVEFARIRAAFRRGAYDLGR